MMAIHPLRRLSLLTASFAVVLTLVCTAPAAAQAPEGSFDRTLNVSGAVDLTVSAGSGSIRVERAPPAPCAEGSVTEILQSTGSSSIDDAFSRLTGERPADRPTPDFLAIDPARRP